MSMGPDFSGGDVPQRSFSERLVGAIRLDATVYEEVEHTPEAMGQAATVVALAVVAQVFGTQDDTGLAGGAFVLVGLVAGFASWLRIGSLSRVLASHPSRDGVRGSGVCP